MAEPFLGQITITAFDFAPKGFALCNGQLLQIAQNQALYSLLGTTYGGDGRTTFALPNLQGRVPLHKGDGMAEGMVGGEAEHTLTMLEMPAHTHSFRASTDTGTRPGGVAGVPADAGAGNSVYAESGNVVAMADAVSHVGGSQAHDNMQPYLTINYCIALVGEYPSRG